MFFVHHCSSWSILPPDSISTVLDLISVLKVTLSVLVSVLPLLSCPHHCSMFRLLICLSGGTLSIICDVSVRMPMVEYGDLICRFHSPQPCRSSSCPITQALSMAAAPRLSLTWSPLSELTVCHVHSSKLLQ